MTDHFKKQEYLVQVTIVEARNLVGKDEGSGTSDPYVKITVGNLPPQVSTTAKATNSMAWNQSFTFSNLFLADTELETMEILLEVFDMNDFELNPLIGSHSIGLATLYRNMNHEFHNIWLPLHNVNGGSRAQGYLLASCYIIGKNDQPPVHAINEIVYFDDEEDDLHGVAEEDLTPEQIKARKDRFNRVAELAVPQIQQRGYQLRVNIAKAEDIIQLGYSAPDSFISVRCAGFTLTTPVAHASQKPVFGTRLQFPVFLPLLNDKIVLRVWDKRTGLPDIYIASIPEVPSDNDSFNINSLLSKGGIMPYRWINLYGIPKDDRTNELYKLLGSKKKIYEGTAYMGRVLMSLNLTPNEKPDKGRFPLNSYREPPTVEYTLLSDVYELQGNCGGGESVWIRVSIGPTYKESFRAYLTAKKEKDAKGIKESYVWKTNKINLDELTIQYPTDQSQIPDIFVSIFSETFWGVKRIAYLRIPVNDPSLTNNDPKWYPLKSVENNIEETNIGYLLLNLYFSFSSSKKKGPRVPKRRNIKAKVCFIVYLHAAYDLAPDVPPDKINPAIEVTIGNETLVPINNIQQGKNPVWEEFIHKEVELTENLEFASNITVRIRSAGTDLLSKGQELLMSGTVGEFSIPAMECIVLKKIDEFSKLEPKLYTLYKDGKPQGRILASFTIIRSIKSLSKFGDLKEYLSQKKCQKIPCNIDLAVVGLRNLPSTFKDATIHLNIAGIKKKIEPLKPIDENDDERGPNHTNPNYLSIIKVTDVSLPEDPLYLPPIEIEVKNHSLLGILGSSLYCSFFAWEYAEWAPSNRLVEVSNFFNTPMIGSSTTKEEKKDTSRKEKKDDKKLEKKPATVAQPKLGAQAKNNLKLVGGIAIDIPGGDLKKFGDALGLDGQERIEMDITMNKNEMKNPGSANKRGADWDIENLQEELKFGKAADKDADSDEDLLGVSTMASDSNFRMDLIEEFDCTKKDKEFEFAEKKKLIDEKVQEIQKLKSDVIPQPEQINKLVQEIKKIQEGYVDAVAKFAGNSDKMNEEYDYGRPVSKDPIEKDLALPYLSYPLYKFNLVGSSSHEEKGIIKSGVLTDAVLKGLIRIVPQTDVQNDDDGKTVRSRLSRASRTSKSSGKNRGLKFKRLDLDPNYPFDIFEDVYLKYFGVSKQLKIRVYLLRALNLSAQSDVVALNNRLAGYNAMSSANTYPIIKIGQGTKQEFDLIKEINDERNIIPNTLNPSYFKSYELDAWFPQDWNLIIAIMNKNTLLSSLIGETLIDLEDRYFGNKLVKQKLTYELKKKDLEAKHRILVQNAENQPGQTNEAAQAEELRKEIMSLTSLIEGIEKPQTLVEYRPLRTKGKVTSQGSMEMFLEILTHDVARTQPVAKVEPPRPAEYEIRLVIYETYDIPKSNGETVDIFVKVSYAPDGWSGNEVVKTTDTHLGSSDGFGIFNWRMKFNLTLPCSFPRLRFSVYDMNVFASDESLGEAAISLRRVLKKLVTEGKFEQPPRKISLSHPNQPGKNLGEILYSLQIIPKMEAESHPVGEAQEEPNENPYLEKPKIGRGISDFLKGAGFNFNIWGFFSGRVFKIILGVISSLVIAMILFVQPGILVKGSQ